MRRTEAIEAAEILGRNARINGTAKAPAQCRELQPILKEFSRPIGESDGAFLAILKSWNKGYAAEDKRITDDELSK